MSVIQPGVLRLATGLMVVVSMIGAGFLHRSPWIVALVTPAFTLLYAVGKWQAWKAAWRLGGAKQIALAVVTTVPIQAILAGVLYLLGLGLGRLLGYQPIVALSAADALSAGLLLTIGLALGATIIRLESSPAPEHAVSSGHTSVVVEQDTSLEDSAPEDGEVELDIDPSPVTVDTLVKSPGHWRINAARQALEGPVNGSGTTVRKPPLAASEDMILAAEARLGVRLPETLRAVYRRINGGYIGWVFVPLSPDPGPVYDDWRGAFSIDYSSLDPVDKLRSVAEHYEDFTHDEEDVPADAAQLIILQARYGDMTLLDYSRGPRPRVLIVDFDKHGGDPVDVVFEDFDTFLAALRRDRDSPFEEPVRRRELSRPLGATRPEGWARRFWGEGKQHPFYVNAAHRKDGSEPKLQADDELISDTHTRLGVTLPPALIDLWRTKNGGGVASRFVEVDRHGVLSDVEVLVSPVPLEYVVSLAELSDRIEFAPGEDPWRELHDGAARLIVLDADHDRAVLLDYRDRPDDLPAVLVVGDLGRSLSEAIRFEHWDDLMSQLRFQRNGWYEVAAPHPADLADEP